VGARPAAWHAALRLQFLALGLAMGVWGAQVPALKAQHRLDEGSLSLVLLAASAGAVLCLFSAGALVARFGARRCVRVAWVLVCAVLPLVLQVQGLGALLALALLLGAANAVADVAVNAEANHLEAACGRPVMSGLHAMFSLGGLAGSLATAGLYRLHWPATQQLLLAAALLAPLALLSAGALSHQRGDSDERPAAPAWPRGVLLWLGLLTALCMVSEGAMYDWSALYVQQELRTDASWGAIGFAAFSAAMTAGRLGGDAVRARCASVHLLQGCGLLAAAGMALALLGGHLGAALAGYALMGLGLANVVPVLFAAAGQTPGVVPAQGVAAVSSVGYVGFMVGPVLIGTLARHASLGAALWVVAGFALALALGARRALRPAG
jgi:predicted MFS family arabinose efflux permease